MEQGRRWGRKRRWSECETAPTRKRPSHELTGIGRFSHLYSENGLLGRWPTSVGLPCPCRCNVLTSSCLPLVYLGLPGSLPVNPLHPLSGWPFMHTPHKRLLPEPSRIPHHQYGLSAPRLPESNYPSGPARRRWFRSLPQHGGSGSHVALLAPGGLHEGAPIRRDGGAVGMRCVPTERVRPVLTRLAEPVAGVLTRVEDYASVSPEGVRSVSSTVPSGLREALWSNPLSGCSAHLNSMFALLFSASRSDAMNS